MKNGASAPCEGSAGLGLCRMIELMKWFCMGSATRHTRWAALVAVFCVSFLAANQGVHAQGVSTGTENTPWPAAKVPASAAQLANSKPILDTDSGGHRASVGDIELTPDGRLLLSASDDRTVRVWSLARGETVRVIRGERGSGDHGKIYSIAITPDSRTVAIGGQIGEAQPYGPIRLVDIQTGQQLRRFSGHEGIVQGLAYSKSGAYLASAGSEGYIRVWDAADGRLLATLPHPKAHKVAFIDENTVVSGGYDGTVRVAEWIRPAKAPAVFEVTCELYALAVSPDGRYIAAGDSTGLTQVWSWPEAKLLTRFQAHKEVSGLAFGTGARSGQIAVASGKHPFHVQVWDIATETRIATYSNHDNRVMALAAIADGSGFVSAGGNRNEIEIWNPDQPKTPKAVLAGGGRSVWSVGFLRAPEDASQSGTYVAWGFTDPCPGVASCPEKFGTLEYALRLPDTRNPKFGEPRRLSEGSNLKEAGHESPYAQYRARLKSGDAEIARQMAPRETTKSSKYCTEDDRFPKLTLNRGGEKSVISDRDLSNGNDHYSYSFGPSGTWLVSGGRNGTLETFDASGTKRADLKGHDGDVQAVAVSEDGRLIVSGSNDTTVRLWNSETGKLVVSIIHMPATGQWIAWTPEGYFTAAPDSENLIGWHINRGPDKEGEFITAGEIRAQFRRSDVVARAIILANSEQAHNELVVRTAASPVVTIDDLAVHSPPKLYVVEPPKSDDLDQPIRIKTGDINLVFNVPPQSTPITAYTIYVNGSQVLETAAAAITDISTGQVRLKVPLYQGFNNVLVVARNEAKLEREYPIYVFLDAIGAKDVREKAYVVAIGINKQPKAGTSTLQYAANDAIEFAASLSSRLSVNHKTVVPPIVLADAPGASGEPTRANILAALNIFKQAGPDDTSILFIAGHGTNRGAGPSEEFTLLSSDAERDTQGFKPSTVVPWSDIQKEISRGSGRKIIFIDACRSSHLFDNELSAELTYRKFSVYLSSQPQTDALESIDKPHGEFTQALLDGIAGSADRNKDRKLRFDELGIFIQEQVLNSTEGRQEPQYFKPPAIPSFDIVRY